LRPAGGVVHVGGTTGMRVSEVLVTKGQRVTAGEELAHLQDYSLRVQEIELAQRALEEGKARRAAERDYALAAQRQAEVALTQARQQKEQLVAQQEQLKVLQSSARAAQANFDRVQGLSERVVSVQEREQLALAVEQAGAAVQEGRAKLDQTRSAQEFAIQNAQAQLQAAQANLQRVEVAISIEALVAQIELAQQKLEQSTVRAPIAGTVLEIGVQPGEVIGPQPIVQLGNVDQMEAVAEVYETDIGLVKAGQRATVYSPALPQTIEGTVADISTVVAPNQIIGLDPAARADVRVVPVTIRLDHSDAAARLVNLQVDVTIDVGGRAAQAEGAH
jgi:HlyD family secretion protein